MMKRKYFNQMVIHLQNSFLSFREHVKPGKLFF